jgi:glucose-1-phosphate adenylyltransferase
MKLRAVILAGGEGSRLSILTAKRTKPAVPFGGKYRIIDFTLSNCVNSGIFDVMIIAQYRPHSLIEHIGAGGPWDLNRDFTGGVRIYSPYRARGPADWFMGTADAVQQNFRWVKDRDPDLIMILSGDHIYEMNYDPMITFHRDQQADLTIGSIQVPMEEASRFGILDVDQEYRVKSFIEKPKIPPSNLVNMGVYIFNTNTLDEELWHDHTKPDSKHDFGGDIIPHMVNSGKRVFAYPYSGYWVDVGTIDSYWQAHMDLLEPKPSINLNDRSWVIHTRTEERPPVRFERGSQVIDSMITDGCVLRKDCLVERSILSAGVLVESGAIVRESIILTDAVIRSGAIVERAVIDKKVEVGSNARVGKVVENTPAKIVMAGKKSVIPPGFTIEPGAVIGTDVSESDFATNLVVEGEYISTKRQANEV